MAQAQTIKASHKVCKEKFTGPHLIPASLQTAGFLSFPEAYVKKIHGRYGDAFLSRVLFRDTVVIVGPEYIGAMLTDQTESFSSHEGWNPYLDGFFQNGLMLRDFADHKFHRGVMQKLFRPKALQSYLSIINQVVDSGMEEWAKAGSIPFYEGVKSLALNIAAKAFVGVDPDHEDAKKLNQSFVDMVQATLTVVRKPVLNNAYAKGIRGRRFLEEYFGSKIEEKKTCTHGDMFSYLCQIRDEDGQGFSDQEIIDHMIFLLMAAHDTVTSTLTTLLYYLTKNRNWIERLRQESEEKKEQSTEFDWISKLKSYEWCMNEAMRLMPPVHSIPRYTLKEVTIKGLTIPASLNVSASVYLTHRDPRWWKNPDSFDPERFSEERAEHKQHSHLYLPFGAGSHRCIGLVFANLMVKTFLHRLVHRFDFSLEKDRLARLKLIPIPKPVGRMQLILQVRS